mmetsp:Transcript_51078/g.121351  ORF Transcript_51078/g.121351 Transcript_51078/m.121351 type:complete len:250 (+) Transcript_51078:1975-2724(+)
MSAGATSTRVSRACCTGSAIMAAFSHSNSIPETRRANSPNNLPIWIAASWSFRASRYSSIFTWAALRRAVIFSISSMPCSLAMGAKAATCEVTTSASRRACCSAVAAIFTTFSVSFKAPICISRSSSKASMARGAATRTMRSAASSTRVTFSSKDGRSCSSFAESCSSRRRSCAVACFLGPRADPSPGAADGAAVLASLPKDERNFWISWRIFASRSISAGSMSNLSMTMFTECNRYSQFQHVYTPDSK